MEPERTSGNPNREEPPAPTHATAARGPALSNLTAGLAHELRNPLSTILQAVDFLGRQGPTDTGAGNSTGAGAENNAPPAKVLGTVAEAARRIEDVVRGLERLSHHHHHPAKHDLNAVVTGALDTLGETIAAAAVELEPDLASDLPEIDIDAAAVETMIETLIHGAVRALERLPHGSPRNLALRTHLDPESAHAIVEIEDSAHPLTSDDIDLDSAPFAPPRSDTALSHLDFAVAHRIMHLHRGSLDVKNRSGNTPTTEPTGVRVTARFPVTPK